ncbi:hypothetical protein Tco_0264304, partial [Tanacetum coccineum]
YAPRNVIKGQVLADFKADTVTRDDSAIGRTPSPKVALDPKEVPESAHLDRPIRRRILLRLLVEFQQFKYDAEYEALLTGLRIATGMKVKKMHAFVDSNL